MFFYVFPPEGYFCSATGVLQEDGVCRKKKLAIFAGKASKNIPKTVRCLTKCQQKNQTRFLDYFQHHDMFPNPWESKLPITLYIMVFQKKTFHLLGILFVNSFLGGYEFPWFFDLQTYMFDSFPRWLVNPNLFPASAGAGTFGEFQLLGIFLLLLDGWLKSWKNFPPNLWRLSKIFGEVVVYFKKGPDFDFQTPKLGCSSKILQAPSQLATENPT